MSRAQTPTAASPASVSGSGETNHSAALMTVEEVAARLRVGKSQVWRLARSGALPTVRVGRYYRWRVDAIDAWEREGGCSG